jgi:hypothetical protein
MMYNSDRRIICMGMRRNRMMNVFFFPFHDSAHHFDDCTQFRLFIVQTVLRDASNVSNVHVPPRHYIKTYAFLLFLLSFPVVQRDHQIFLQWMVVNHRLDFVVSPFSTAVAAAMPAISSSSSSSHSPSSSSPKTLFQALLHKSFLCSSASIITPGRCHTLAQNRPRALPL